MDVEFALAGSVWDWTRQHCPDDPHVAERAVAMAMSSYAGGASVAEACEQAWAFVASWGPPSCTRRGGPQRAASVGVINLGR